MKAYIKNGFWGKSKKMEKGNLDLRRYIRDTVSSFGVAVADSCCDEFQEGSSPVRYTSSGLQYYDKVTKTWEAVPAE